MDIDAARRVLDLFEIPNRLQHVRRYIWREGALRFVVLETPGRAQQACYELSASWPAPVLEGIGGGPPQHELERRDTPVVEGRWVLGTRGYLLRAGIDLAVPSAIALRADRLHTFVPFAGRLPADVAHALQTDLDGYVNTFLSACAPVPEARATAARRLASLGLQDASVPRMRNQR